MIWNNQRYLEHPALGKSEVPGFKKLRKWTSKFYPMRRWAPPPELPKAAEPPPASRRQAVERCASRVIGLAGRDTAAVKDCR